MAENKTKATDASVFAHLAAITDENQRADCEVLSKLMSKVTGYEPKVWGSAIVGFGAYHYRYESGREGDSCLTGFAARKDGLAVYLVAEAPDQAALLNRLGKHKMGKACLTIRRLSDVDTQVLEKLVAGSVAEIQRRYP
jgi:hypothetical protein